MEPAKTNCEMCQTEMLDVGQTKCYKCSKDYEEGLDDQLMRMIYKLRGEEWMIEKLNNLKRNDN